MTLGERIYTLRTERNLSQGDLADALDVSRQSISKWENNNSVPDLDKLVKLSDLFGVSLDELVKGETTEPAEPEEGPKQEPGPAPVPRENGFPPRKIAGTILLCMGFLVLLVLGVLVDLLSGLFFSVPFFLCGATCFVFRKHTGLWCGWAAALALDVSGRWVMGHYGGFAQILRILRDLVRGDGIATGNLMCLLVSAVVLVLVITTAVCLRKRPLVKQFQIQKKTVDLSMWHLCSIVLLWAVVAVWFAVGPLDLGSVGPTFLPRWFIVFRVVTDWSWLAVLICTLTLTLQYIHTYRRKKTK